MGFLDALAGRTRVLKYEIVFTDREVGVRVTPDVPVVQPPDYIRLWACYQAKIVYNLGFPQGTGGLMGVGSVAKVVERPIDPSADCFQRANFDDVMRFTSAVPTGHTRFTGEFYAKGATERTVKTHFSLRISEQQVVYSGLAMMQYAIQMNRGDGESLQVLTDTARNLVGLIQSVPMGVQAVTQIPNLAYLQAIGVA